MLKPVAFANSFTVVGLTGYILCRILAFIAPDFLFVVAQSWFHTINLETLKATIPMDLGTFILGGGSVSIVIWVATYTAASLYNKFSK